MMGNKYIDEKKFTKFEKSETVKLDLMADWVYTDEVYKSMREAQVKEMAHAARMDKGFYEAEIAAE